MIGRERLYELIKQRAKIYGIGKHDNVFCVGLKFANFDKQPKEWQEQKLETYGNFFETIEDAEKHLAETKVSKTKRLTEKELLALKAVVYGCNTNRKCENGIFCVWENVGTDNARVREEMPFYDALEIMFKFIEQEEKNGQENNN